MVSEALGDVPQAAKLDISFHIYQPLLRRNGRQKPYPVFEVRVSGPTEHYDGGWGFLVWSVPNNVKHSIHELLVAEGFARVKRWLEANVRRGQATASFAVMFDETEKQLAYHDEVR